MFVTEQQQEMLVTQVFSDDILVEFITREFTRKYYSGKLSTLLLHGVLMVYTNM